MDFDPLIVRKFWDFVIRRGDNECWDWKGTHVKGYGRMRVGKKMVQASRFSYQLHNGEIPERNFVCHRCDYPPCTNPQHLFLGTAKINAADAVQKGRHVSGERNGASVLDNAQVLEICVLYATGKWNPREIADKLGAKQQTVKSVIFGNTWKYLISPSVRKILSEIGQQNHKRRLDAAGVAEMRRLYRNGGHTHQTLAAMYQVSPYTISDALNRVTWKQID